MKRRKWGKREKRERRSIIYKLGEVNEMCEKQNGRRRKWERKAGNMREGILMGFFTLVFGKLRQSSLENGIML